MTDQFARFWVSRDGTKRFHQAPFDRVETLGRLRVVEKGELTSLERQALTEVDALFARLVKRDDNAMNGIAVTVDGRVFVDPCASGMRVVRWVDSSVQNGQVGSSDFPKPVVITSVGFVVEETDDYIVLARDDMGHDGDFRGLCAIPKFAVLPDAKDLPDG